MTGPLYGLDLTPAVMRGGPVSVAGPSRGAVLLSESDEEKRAKEQREWLKKLEEAQRKIQEEKRRMDEENRRREQGRKRKN